MRRDDLTVAYGSITSPEALHPRLGAPFVPLIPDLLAQSTAYDIPQLLMLLLQQHHHPCTLAVKCRGRMQDRMLHYLFNSHVRNGRRVLQGVGGAAGTDAVKKLLSTGVEVGEGCHYGCEAAGLGGAGGSEV